MRQTRQIKTPEGLLCEIVRILDELKISYAVTGGIAVAVWARPRFTADIDIVVELMPEQIDALTQRLLLIDKDAYLDKELIKEAFRYKREFNFIHPQTGLKVDFWILKNDAWDKKRVNNPVVKTIDGQKINFVSPEDLVLSKLLWLKISDSPKQIEDIKSVLKINKVNMDYIK